MSVNYAAGLSPYDNKGKCGLPEIYDSKLILTEKINKLSEWVRNSRHLVVNTGAGVSTAAGIPDFRGPQGVWTLEAEGIAPKINTTFDAAVPTFTHMALVTLEKMHILKYLITQNVDGLHLRSGFPRDRLSELHGNVFVEHCSVCDFQHVRNSAVGTVGQKFTGKICERRKGSGRICRGKLRDSVLDWEANLPETDLILAEQQSKLADLNICLGSTLQIVPAGTLPISTKKSGGRLVIVNLQQTKLDKHADLIIRAKVDDVMKKLLQNLNITSEIYIGPVLNLRSINGRPILRPEKSKFLKKFDNKKRKNGQINEDHKNLHIKTDTKHAKKSVSHFYNGLNLGKQGSDVISTSSRDEDKKLAAFANHVTSEQSDGAHSDELPLSLYVLNCKKPKIEVKESL